LRAPRIQVLVHAYALAFAFALKLRDKRIELRGGHKLQKGTVLFFGAMQDDTFSLFVHVPPHD
jgi:hypothetical protein